MRRYSKQLSHIVVYFLSYNYISYGSQEKGGGLKGNKKNSEAHAKTSQKEVATMGQLPDAEFSEMPLPPLRLSEEAAPALLPWLAKGYTPIRTSGKNNMCGLYALWRAFRDAQDALKSPNEKIKHLTQAQFRGFLNSR